MQYPVSAFGRHSVECQRACGAGQDEARQAEHAAHASDEQEKRSLGRRAEALTSGGLVSEALHEALGVHGSEGRGGEGPYRQGAD